MSELVRMRQRMKAVETIKKITHAMRLIAMSTHSRLRSKKSYLEEYQKELTELYTRIKNAVPMVNQPPSITTSGITLAIIIGSQKGLCGNFNSNIYFFSQEALAQKNRQQLHIITIGKRISDYFSVSYGTIIQQLEVFNATTLTSIAQYITQYILSEKDKYSSVLLLSNYPKTFFVQKPQITTLLPFIPDTAENLSAPEYSWEQPSEEIIEHITQTLLYAKVQSALFQSLIAEQSARFLAMDSSTRNATNLLDTMRLNYNKMRQTKITRELTDLVGSF